MAARPAEPEATLLRWLEEARRVLAFCGAGISAESGLPTFRGAGGLWEGHRVEDVASPEGFARNPRTVWRFYAMRQEALLRVEPNPAHRALAAMERRYPAFLVVSQNVDDLHERAGSRELVKLHGNLMETRCVRCDAVRPLVRPVSPAAVGAGELPRCSCGGVLRPNVVWFGEYLDPGHLRRIDDFLRAGRREPSVLLAIGTSGEVSGGYGILQAARAAGFRTAEVNPEPTLLSGDADLVLRAPAGALLARVCDRLCPPA